MAAPMARSLGRLARRGDLVIAILMLVAVIMMIIPLPTALVDALISANMATSVLILLVAFYVAQPLDFSSLPSVILMATLFRLAITITTSRLILLQADAGEIVSTFGAFVIGGSIAVGLVIFLIITIAQFVVITKGAERVAEVAARFTLDALPGKQMSIDADLRNGDIDQAEARRLRHRLERESQLYGAMDGAMKFVKGDAIAGLVVIVVNLLGGLAIGTLQHGMSLGQAAQTYSLLTVGDGLVAQIPALLVSVAAGTVITRVASDEESNLGAQIAGQLSRDARALALAAAILVVLSLVPGFPAPVFLAMAAIFATGAYVQYRSRAPRMAGLRPVAAELVEHEGRGGPPELAEGEETRALGPPARVIVRMGAGLSGVVSEEAFAPLAQRIRHRLRDDLGVEVPGIDMRRDAGLCDQRFRIDLEGAPIAEAEIPQGRILVEDEAAHLELAGVEHEEGPPLAGRRKALWVDAVHGDTLTAAGVTTLGPLEAVGRALEHAMRSYAGHFVGIQETGRLLAAMEADYADLVKEAQGVVPLQKMAEILRRLVDEDVPIRNMRLILEALVEWGQREQDVVLLTEYVRMALKRQICFRMADRNRVIAAYVLERPVEEMLRAAVRSTSAGAFLNISDDGARILVGQIEQALAETEADAEPVVLAAMDVRRHARALLARHEIDLAVLSYQELAPEFSVQPLATITKSRAERGAQQSSETVPDAGEAAARGSAV
ncbi:type III secretion system export apparatus subunit SctV [Kaustia mangrovi]|uniref:Type III secretion system export apparatus subunit SctV n=1 Tax=Kaustia mangrovi TaxID=2593653 RepID=A0A7S8C415_9HYPH|nr:type III secretion system export apparatus subunit SctV [Kaustia mangrovi]QPC42956.1 type III secretion system export apparatus subunit SctV [Kaustia mangrovi]